MNKKVFIKSNVCFRVHIEDKKIKSSKMIHHSTRFSPKPKIKGPYKEPSQTTFDQYHKYD